MQAAPRSCDAAHDDAVQEPIRRQPQRRPQAAAAAGARLPGLEPAAAAVVAAICMCHINNLSRSCLVQNILLQLPSLKKLGWQKTKCFLACGSWGSRPCQA